MSEFFTERRKYYRINCELDIRYKYISQFVEIKESKFLESKSNNISVGGVYFHAILPDINYIPKMFLNEINILVYIFFPREVEPVKAISSLRHISIIDKNINLFGMGVEFTEMSSQDKNALSAFILSKI